MVSNFKMNSSNLNTAIFAYLLQPPCYSLTPLFLLCYYSSQKSPRSTVSPHLSKQALILKQSCLPVLANQRLPASIISQEPIHRAAIHQAEEKYSKTITPKALGNNIPIPLFVSTDLKGKRFSLPKPIATVPETRP